MASRKRPRRPLPILLAEMTLASWETIARRSLMIAAGTCSPAEYRRMVREKAIALQRSGLALMRLSPDRVSTALAPWHRAARANARRLRKRRAK
jgi:hypothetical protein